MIGKNLKITLVFAGALAAVAAAMPAISQARTHYTGKTPVDIAMMATTPVTPPVGFVSPKTVHHKVKHKKVRKTSLTKHHAHKMIKVLRLKHKAV